jgi:hypothetical protein
MSLVDGVSGIASSICKLPYTQLGSSWMCVISCERSRCDKVSALTYLGGVAWSIALPWDEALKSGLSAASKDPPPPVICLR